MKFGAKEVMVIAALTFGIIATGCGSTDVNLASRIQPWSTGAGADDHTICYSRHEIEPCCQDGGAVVECAAPERELMAPVTGGPGAAGEETRSQGGSWSVSLPRFFK
jgi:hypothetical protein